MRHGACCLPRRASPAGPLAGGLPRPGLAPTNDGWGCGAPQVKVPDVYGVFKWVLQYRRLGYSFIELTGAALPGRAGRADPPARQLPASRLRRPFCCQVPLLVAVRPFLPVNTPLPQHKHTTTLPSLQPTP